jgi:hypothetical protein
MQQVAVAVVFNIIVTDNTIPTLVLAALKARMLKVVTAATLLTALMQTLIQDLLEVAVVPHGQDLVLERR